MNLKTIILTGACTGAALAITPAQAFDLTVGAQAWNEDLKIEARYQGSTNSFNSDHDYKPVIWAQLEHNISILPNLKVRYTDLERTAGTAITGSIKIDDVVYSDSDFVHTKTTLTHYDVIPYYNIFDNKIFSASLGLDVKIGHFKIAGWTQTESARADIKGALPLPYAAAEVNLPFNFFIKGDVAGFGIKDYAIYDYEVAAGWKAIDTDIIDTAVEVGYRKFYLSGDDIEDLNVHAKADGFFAGVSINY